MLTPALFIMVLVCAVLGHKEQRETYQLFYLSMGGLALAMLLSLYLPGTQTG